MKAKVWWYGGEGTIIYIILLFLLGVQMVHQLVVQEYNSVELEVVSKLVLFDCRGVF